MKNTITFVTHSAGTLTWELPQGFPADIPQSVKRVIEAQMSRVLDLFMCHICVDEHAALRILERFGQGLSAAKAAQDRELMRIQ